MSSVATAVGFYESRPLVAGVMLRLAGRSATLSAEDQAGLAQVLASRRNLPLVGRVLDALQATNSTPDDAAPNAKLGDGTILQLLIQNLPAIIAAILQIMNAFPKPAARFAAESAAMPTNFALPPAVIVLAEQAAEAALSAALQAVLPSVKGEVIAWLSDHKIAA